MSSYRMAIGHLTRRDGWLGSGRQDLRSDGKKYQEPQQQFDRMDRIGRMKAWSVE